MPHFPRSLPRTDSGERKKSPPARQSAALPHPAELTLLDSAIPVVTLVCVRLGAEEGEIQQQIFPPSILSEKKPMNGTHFTEMETET